MDAKPEDVGLSSERLMRVNTWARRLVDDGKLAGITTMVLRHDKVVHFNTCGLADIKRAKPMAADTIFRFYSMTKPLTSTAIMMLYEEGRFQLEIRSPVPAVLQEHARFGWRDARQGRDGTGRTRHHLP